MEKDIHLFPIISVENKFHIGKGVSLLKVKIAICLKDAIYQERFMRCLMKHYGERYEFHMFASITELLHEEYHQYAGYILDENDKQELEWEEAKLQKVFFLQEEDKYQEVYRIMEQVERLLLAQEGCVVTNHKIKPIIIAVYSLDIPAVQIPLSKLISEILGEKRKTIFVDLQEYSGFTQEGELGLEDMFAMMLAENYIHGRAISAIGRGAGWDYIYPLRNSRCLLEVTDKALSSMVKYLINDLGYEALVFNLGGIVANLEGVFGLCNKILLPCARNDIGKQREKNFIEELEKKEAQNVLHRIHRMEVPTVSGTDGDWKRIMEQWRWGQVGDALRKVVLEENEVGAHV